VALGVSPVVAEKLASAFILKVLPGKMPGFTAGGTPAATIKDFASTEF